MTEYLTLSAIPEPRQKVRIRTEADPDGSVYELADPADFGAVEFQGLGSDLRAHDELLEAPKLTKAQERRLESLLDSMVARLIREVPAEAVAALPAMTKRGLVAGFFARCALETERILSFGRAAADEA